MHGERQRWSRVDSEDMYLYLKRHSVCHSLEDRSDNMNLLHMEHPIMFLCMSACLHEWVLAPTVQLLCVCLIER